MVGIENLKFKRKILIMSCHRSPNDVRFVTHCINALNLVDFKQLVDEVFARGGGGVLPYMGYIGMCRREGYGFQAVYSSIGYINQSVWV